MSVSLRHQTWDEDRGHKSYHLTESAQIHNLGKGIVFRLMNGHWQVAVNRPDALRPTVRFTDDQALLIGGRYYRSEHIYLVEPGGVRIVPYGKEETSRLDPRAAVTPIASSLSYIHTYHQSYKLLEGNLTLSTPGTRKDAIVVDSDGALVKPRRLRGSCLAAVQRTDWQNLLLSFLQAPAIGAMVVMTYGSIRVDFAEQHAASTKEIIFLLVIAMLWYLGMLPCCYR